MKRPDINNTYYRYRSNGVTIYVSDLEKYINHIESKFNIGVLADVSQQRELLIAFAEWTQRKVSYSDCVQVKDVDKFIKESNL